MKKSAAHSLAFPDLLVSQCYEPPTMITTNDSSFLGASVLAVGFAGEPWMSNAMMKCYTLLCVSMMWICSVKSFQVLWTDDALKVGKPVSFAKSSVSLLAETRYDSVPEPLAMARSLYVSLFAWQVSLVIVACLFVLLPISRMLVFVGLSHNLVEWNLIYELLGRNSSLGAVWMVMSISVLLLEFFGALIFGGIISQWTTFGVLGAMCDLVLMCAAIYCYVQTRMMLGRESKKSLTHRFHLFLAISSHFTYVVFYFLNCHFYPPILKLLGPLLNTFASYCVFRFLAGTKHSCNRLVDDLYISSPGRLLPTKAFGHLSAFTI